MNIFLFVKLLVSLFILFTVTTETETFGGQCEDITGCEDTLFCIHNTCQCAGEDFWNEDACVHVTSNNCIYNFILAFNSKTLTRTIFFSKYC